LLQPKTIGTKLDLGAWFARLKCPFKVSDNLKRIPCPPEVNRLTFQDLLIVVVNASLVPGAENLASGFRPVA
ncbi:MAG: hypothetical protein ACJAXZ_002860, partial [Akkermansiaceae bacterium]